MSTPIQQGQPGSAPAGTPALAGETSAVQQALRRDAAWRWWEWALLAALAASWFLLPQHALLGNAIAILALFALSLDLILGYAGIVSLGHAAFFGTGAYAAALFAKHFHPDPLLGLAAATATAALLGLATSALILRGTDLTRLMVTLGVAAVLYELANRFDDITGGADGLQGVLIGTFPGGVGFDLQGRVAWAYSLIVLIAALLLCRRIVHSPFGIGLQALRDNRLRAAALGLNVNARLAAVYTLSAALAGAAGALQAQTTGFASLDVLDFHRSADVMLVVVIGGAGWLWGGVLGAIGFTLLHDLISALTPQYWTFWLGLFLVVLMLVGRERLLRPWTWLKRTSA
ncbi:branched-chain amino acid ABC transporter permease [Azohydromonas aeria]|uniref:branched-chain amino acid ABC transporter permease n=1 Tax=Azohydromonas aeria TaxID=2590212 RepID=UPI0012F8E438|nr:branched-chain amino acid ABC transporter permease [Azohydromonas aeria]